MTEVLGLEFVHLADLYIEFFGEHAEAMGDLEACGCFEKTGVEAGERLVYKGEGMGSYAQVSSMETLGSNTIICWHHHSMASVRNAFILGKFTNGLSSFGVVLCVSGWWVLARGPSRRRGM